MLGLLTMFCGVTVMIFHQHLSITGRARDYDQRVDGLFTSRDEGATTYRFLTPSLRLAPAAHSVLRPPSLCNI